MKTSKQILFATAIAASMLFAGCGSVPQQEIDSANAAINAAKTAGAEIYANEEFTALQDSMKVALESIETGKSKIIKNYGDAKEMLLMVTGKAGEVKLLAETRIEELKVKIQASTDEINRLIAENKQLLSEAPKGKEGTTALVAIRNENSLIETSLAEAATMFANADYQGADMKLSAALEKAMSINTELSGVIDKYKAATRGR